MRKYIPVYGKAGPCVLIGLVFLVTAGEGLASQTETISHQHQAFLKSDTALHFEPAARGAFMSREPGYTLVLDRGGFRLRGRQDSIRVELLDTRAGSTLSAQQKQESYSNYILGADPARWRTRVPHFQQVTQEDAWPGVDIVYAGGKGSLEYGFVVDEAANLEGVAVRYDGVERLGVDDTGNLVLHTRQGQLKQPRPWIKHRSPAGEVLLAANYVTDGRVVRFASGGPRDRYAEATVPAWSMYFGSSKDDGAFDADVDAEGNLYIAGLTDSPDLPATEGAFDPVFNPSQTPLLQKYGDGFVAKYDPNGELVYLTYLGGTDADGASAIAVDDVGNAHVLGATVSGDFPLTDSAYQKTKKGLSDLFVTKLDPTGSMLLYSTYLGGSGDLDYSFEGSDITLDRQGKMYVTGATVSTDFPMKGTPPQRTFRGGDTEAFIAKMDPMLNGAKSLVYSTYLGGRKNEVGLSIAVDSAGVAYVRGGTCSTDFPTTANAWRQQSAGDCDVFLTKLSADGSQWLYSTYLGGSDDDYGIHASGSQGPLPIGTAPKIFSSEWGGSAFGAGLAIDESGKAYVAGATESDDFPVKGAAYQATPKGDMEAFLSILDTTAQGADSLVYSTYLGGRSTDRSRVAALDSEGRIFIHGETYSPDFPTTAGALQTQAGGGYDSFLTVFSADGSELLYSTFHGGGSAEQGLYGMAIAPGGDVYLAGATRSNNLPVYPPALANTRFGQWDGFVVKMSNPLQAAVTLLSDRDQIGVMIPQNSATPAEVAVNLTSDGDDISFDVTFDEDWLSADITSGQTPAEVTITCDHTGLAAGEYTGSVTVTSAQASNSPLVIETTMTVAPPRPLVNSASIGNAASYQTGGVAPGEIIVFWGSMIGPPVLAGAVVTDNMFATEVGETRVLFDGVASPIIYAFETQTSVVVPFGVAGKESVQMVVEYQGIAGDPVTVPVVKTMPGVFTVSNTGAGQGAILNAPSYALNGPENPAEFFSAVMVFGTTGGGTGTDGALAPGVGDLPMNVEATVGGKPAQVLYKGDAPGLIFGLTQFNIMIPGGAPTGDAVPLVITVDGIPCQPNVTLAIQ